MLPIKFIKVLQVLQIKNLRLLLIVVLASLTFIIYGANGKCGPSAIWELSQDGTLVISGFGEMKNTSKSSVPWRPDLVFKIVVNEGISRIGNNSFAGCKNLQVVELPSTLKTIGISSFSNCKKLTKINIPGGVESIEESAFENCLNLTSVKMPESLGSLGEKVFANCKGLVQISLPFNLTSIGLDAFKGCDMITDIHELPDFIQASTCDRFGLNSSAVEKYRLSIASKDLTLSAIDGEGISHDKSFPHVVSDVDIDIPVNMQNNSDTYAFIISNEKYQHLADVPYADKDGSIFSIYCRQILSMPDDNVRLIKNASYLNMMSAIEEIKRIDQAYEGEAKFILYYSGHGMPDDKDKNAYIVPCDAPRADISFCLPLGSIYDELGSLKSKSVVVFLDACFSGASRDFSMLNNGERGIALKTKPIVLSGNVAVLSATSGSQTAQPFVEKGHGLFTYFLLKALKDSNGEIALGEIKDYIRKNVKRASVSGNLKEQTPTANISAAVSDEWEDWILK